MQVAITTKGFKLSAKDREKFDHHLDNLKRRLIKFKEDLPLLNFVLRKDKTVSSSPKAKSAYYYEGTMKLLLPKKPLIAHVRNSYVIESIEEAFQRIFKELQTYKGKHFKSHSDYKNHDSLKSKLAA